MQKGWITSLVVINSHSGSVVRAVALQSLKTESCSDQGLNSAMDYNIDPSIVLFIVMTAGGLNSLIYITIHSP